MTSKLAQVVQGIIASGITPVLEVTPAPDEIVMPAIVNVSTFTPPVLTPFQISDLVMPSLVNTSVLNPPSLGAATDQALVMPSLVNASVLNPPTIAVPADPQTFWRINIEAVGSGSTAALCELEFYETKFGPNLVFGGTPDADSYFNANYMPAEAFDGLIHDEGNDASSLWGSDGAALPHWLSYEFSVPVNVQAIGLHGRWGAATNQVPKDFSIDFSSDGISWTTLWSETGLTWSEFEFKRLVNPGYTEPGYSGSPHGAHAYWQIFIPDGSEGAAVSLTEMEMRATPSGADQCTGGTASASSEYDAGYVAANAFDNTGATFWHCAGGTGWAWLRYQFASPVEVAEVMLRSRNSGSPIGAPTFFAMMYADDPAGPWTTAWTEVPAGSWANDTIRTYTDPNYI